MIHSPFQIRFPRGYGAVGGGAPSATTVFLANFNGVDGATTYSSEIPVVAANTIVTSEIDTAQKMFGSASWKQIDAGASLGFDCYVANGNEHLIRLTDEWTIEGFFRILAGATGQVGFDHWDDGFGTGESDVLIGFDIATQLVTHTVRDSDANILINAATAAVTIVGDTWYHFAYTYDGSALQLYFNGSRVANTAAVSKQFNVNVVNFATDIGTNWVDSYRISRGCRYTGASLTIPVAELT